MKLIIFLAVCVFATNAIHQLTFSELTNIWQRFLLKHIDECIEKSGADRNLAERILPYGEYPDDAKLKCFAKCVAGKLHLVGSDAEAHQHHYLDILNIHDPAIRKDVISQCFEQICKEDECSQVFYTSECVYYVVKKALTGKGKQPKLDKKKAEF